MDFSLPLFNPYERLLGNAVLLVLMAGLVGVLGGAGAALVARLRRRGLPHLFRPVRHIFLVVHGLNILLDVLILVLPSQGPDDVAAVLLGINAAGTALWFWGARRIEEEEIPRILV
jgi:hypothetical protein